MSRCKCHNKPPVSDLRVVCITARLDHQSKATEVFISVAGHPPLRVVCVSICMNHIFSPGLLMVPYIIIFPGHWICSFIYNFNSPGGIQHCSHVALITCHLCPTRYSFTPEWSEVLEGNMPCPGTQHWYHNVPAVRGEKNYISRKKLHLSSFELARRGSYSFICYSVLS